MRNIKDTNISVVGLGVGVIIVQDGKVLMGLRKGAHGTGTWSFPGGHLEYGETPEICAVRETLEETGMRVEAIGSIGFTNDIFEEEGKHYVTLFIRARIVSGEPRVMEPEKCERWEWFLWDEMPENIFLPIRHLKERRVNIVV